MNAIRVWAALLFIAISAPGVSAAGPEPGAPARLFAQGNESYRKGDFASAGQCYLQLVEARIDSGPVYYNLGNVRFKQKRLGEAIYYWEKARRRMPGDRDLQQNLELANLMVVDRIDVPPSPLPVRAVVRLVHFFSIAQETWLVLAFFVSANVFGAVALIARSAPMAFRALIASLVSAALVVVFGASLAWKLYDTAYRQRGVVVQEKADVRSGPGTDNVTIFTVHEGIVVQVLGTAGGWCQVSLPNGWNGWLPDQSLRIL